MGFMHITFLFPLSYNKIRQSNDLQSCTAKNSAQITLFFPKRDICILSPIFDMYNISLNNFKDISQGMLRI